MTNPCLRPACLSDVPEYDQQAFVVKQPDDTVVVVVPLVTLYDHEWRKRGFERSP